MTAVRARALTRTYPGGVEALRGVDLDVEPGERIAIVGRSGAGKSTLLNALGLLDEPTSGSYRLLGEETVGLHERRRDRLRRRALGFVFQDAHVLGQRTVAENLTVKLATARVPRAERAPRIADSLERVGLSHRAGAAGRLLSGGEKQRLAVARAILTSPAVILADEPTGNLDEVNSRVVRDLFDEQARLGVAVVVITHDDRVATWADRSVTLYDGTFTEVRDP